MHDMQWERWLDALARDYFTAAYRPELPAEERLRAAASCRDVIAYLGPRSLDYLVAELSSADTQRRNAAARALSVRGDANHAGLLVACFLEEGRQWLSPVHLVRVARRHALDPGLMHRVAEVPLRVQPALVRALLAHDTAAARVLLQRLLVGPDDALAEAAVEAVAGWAAPGVLHGILRRVDGTEDPPRSLLVAGIQAALQLARTGDVQALDWLEERTGDVDPELAGLAHAALGALGWPGCLIDLHDHLRESDGVALGYGLEAAELLASSALVPALCDVVTTHAERRGAGLDDNPADHAIRVLEQITGRWVPPELCSYDRHGNLDEATRRRAALLYRSALPTLPADTRLRRGEPLGLRHLISDLLSPSPRRVRAAALQLEARTGRQPGFDPREDLVANLDAVHAWRFMASASPDQPGAFLWRNQVVGGSAIGV